MIAVDDVDGDVVIVVCAVVNATHLIKVCVLPTTLS